MGEGGKSRGLSSQLLTPKDGNLPLYCSFPCAFWWSFMEYFERVRQAVLLAELLDLNKPWDSGRGA